MDNKYRIDFLPDAELDLQAIDEHLSQFSESAPAKFFEELTRILDILRNMPYAFVEYPDNVKYRRAFVFDYLLFYKIIEETHVIQIHAIWHGAMDIRQHIKNLPR